MRQPWRKSVSACKPVALLAGAVALLLNFSAAAASREAQWQAVEDAIRKGLPKTAVTNLEPIIQGAMKDKAYAEAVKAIGRKIAQEANIQGNKPEERILRLEAELAKAPAEMAPVMETLLAHWYWHYFQQNRWRFMQRTTTGAAPGRDFTTWDLPRLFAEIDRHFQRALTGERLLKSTPVEAWNDLLLKGTMPDSYRPTLYDFIAHEALEFYTSSEQAGARPQDAFEFAADSPALGSADEFIRWLPRTTDTNAAAFKAIRLYQDLLRFHQADAAPQFAFANADLERLGWAWNTAFGDDKNRRYKAALEAFIREYADFEVSAVGIHSEARVLQGEGDLVAAHNLARKGADLFPDSPGGKLCRNLIGEIEARSVSILTERVWNAPWPKISLTYRNAQAVHFRAIPFAWEKFLDRSRAPEFLDDKERRELLAQAPALAWSEPLPPTADYKERTEELPAPEKLKPGFYFIFASHDPSFRDTDNVVSAAPVWVSDLALITGSQEGFLEGFVLQANSGEPIEGAEIAAWRMDSGKFVAEAPVSTDQAGRFRFRPQPNHNYILRASHNGQVLANPGDWWANDWEGRNQLRPAAQTVFFTDRALYRPGQTVQYKGICLWVDQAKDDYQVLKGERVTVVFKDSNGKEIARQQQRANDYGSFSGSFTAPRDRLMGHMWIEVEGRARGRGEFRVEEYKRPKFEVKLDPPKTAPRLNDRVTLRGHAVAYTGAAVDGALVKFRVMRETRMPSWWGWWGRGYPSSGNQEIAHGTGRTDTGGLFQLEFIAKPDLSVPEKDEPTFRYEVTADVTDSAGETRSTEESVRVGYTALEASVRVQDWLTDDQPVELEVHTTSLDGEAQVAEGSVKVYALQAPTKAERAPLTARYYPRYGNAQKPQSADLSDPNNWPQGQVVAEKGFTTDTNGTAKLTFKVPVGAYRAVLATQDRFGKKVTALTPLRVLNPADNRLAIRVPNLVATPKWELQPGEEFLALWGTGYEAGRAFVEIESGGKSLASYWTAPGVTQQRITVPVTEAMRGGFTLRVTQVRENRAYLLTRQVEVPWNNKELELSWEHFVSKLEPGKKETWTAVVRPRQGASAEKLAAEFVAALYDESLDAFAPHTWPHQFGIFRRNWAYATDRFANQAQGFQAVFGRWEQSYESVPITYRSFPGDLTDNLWSFGYPRRSYAGRAGVEVDALAREAMPMRAIGTETASAGFFAMELPKSDAKLADTLAAPAPGTPPQEPKPNLGQVTARKNLNETAFFFPQLVSDSNGVVRMTFTMPEALTRWHFLGFAHDQAVRSGFLEGHAVTSKDLMVQPNTPRFLREGDLVEFTVKVSNQSDKPQAGLARLSFAYALSGQPADAALKLQPATGVAPGSSKSSSAEQPFNIPAKESRTLAWRISVPDGCGFLTYKAVAATQTVSDGEEGALPVLSRRILVTESLPLPIRGPATRKFEFDRLLNSGTSKTLRSESLTVQMASNPAWYAVLALPYLMEFPHECSEQVFNRLYANALARSIANGNPKIQRIFEQWKNTPTLDSPLEKNQDLKSVALEETPWLRQAQSESQARRNVGILFDNNRLNDELHRTLRKLTEMQNQDGAWPWFPGGYGNDYITLYITTGFGRLRRLGVDVNVAPALRSLQRLDGWMSDACDRIQRGPAPEKYVPSATDALYLYGRSFFLKDQPIAPAHKKAVDFFLGQSRKFWLETGNRQTQGHLALALRRFDAQDPTPANILKSIKERSVSNEELGTFWRDTELSWWWYRAPIETQALMIEAFDEVMHDERMVEDCRVWLLKQKQTQDWKTTKATADAVYALLLRGRDILASDTLVEVKLGKVDVTPKPGTAAGASVEPGTGLYEYRFPVGEIKPALGQIVVRKTDSGVAWGGVHWQYLEDMSKVTPYAGTPLKLSKKLFTKVATKSGPILEAVKGPLQVGDELVVRIELRVDRDMEFVHLKDQRGSGTEPVNVLSRYRYQDGLGYYESTRDTASHFFIDYLPKGVYVFEYSSRIQLRGTYQTGVAEIQCMYAPEFNSHSESVVLQVK